MKSFLDLSVVSSLLFVLILLSPIRTDKSRLQAVMHFGDQEIIVREVSKQDLRESIRDFAFMSYPEIMTTVDTLVTSITANIETKFSLDLSASKPKAEDVLNLFAEVEQVAHFHARIAESLPEEMYYYTYKVLSDDDAEEIVTDIKNLLKESGHENLRAINDQWEVFKKLAFANLPKNPVDISYFFGVLEEYQILGEKLRINVHPDELEGHLQQVKFITNTFNFFDECKQITKLYKWDMLPAFFGTYLLEWIYKDLETNQDTFAFFDLLRVYTVVVQKEVHSVHYFAEIARRRLYDVKRKFNNLFEKSIEVFDLDPKVYQSVKKEDILDIGSIGKVLVTGVVALLLILG